jgi:hypothetical protein
MAALFAVGCRLHADRRAAEQYRPVIVRTVQTRADSIDRHWWLLVFPSSLVRMELLLYYEMDVHLL